MGSDTSDEALMTAYLGGDMAAFRELFDRHARRLTAILSRASGGDAADLTQQTFLKLHRCRATYRAGAPFRPWLMTIAKNVQREHFRRSTRPVLACDEAAELMPSDAPNAEVSVMLRRAIARVEALPAHERDVIALHCGHGLTLAETAARLGATESAVKARAHRGYRKLRESDRPPPSSP